MNDQNSSPYFHSFPPHVLKVMFVAGFANTKQDGEPQNPLKHEFSWKMQTSSASNPPVFCEIF